MQQRIGFCSTEDGVRIAYATGGTGPPFVVASAGVSHLELEWEEPRIRDFWETIGQHHMVVRYDRHGCGLSDRNRSDFSLDSEVRTIEAIVKELGLKSFVLWGQRFGGVPAIGYAVKLPDRVSHLILCGAQARWHGGTSWGGVSQETHRALVLSNLRMAQLSIAELMLGSAFDGPVRARFSGDSPVSPETDGLDGGAEWIRTAGPARFGRKRPLPVSFSSLSAPIGAAEADRRTTGF
jgi:pimeloyl-ACP methyl ester carboxylesterase